MPLGSLPFDVLLSVYRKLDTRDVVLCGMACSALHESTKDRHVWLDQLQNFCMRNPVLGRALPSLHSLSTEELKHHTIHQEKLRLRWNQVHSPPEPFYHSPGRFDSRGSMWLMPGGKTVLFVSERGAVSLHRFRTCGENLIVIPLASHTMEGERQWVWVTLIPGNGSSPLLACKAVSHRSVELISIDHERGVIYPEAVVQIPKEKAPVRFARQGRLVACMLSPGGGSRSLMIIHLDRPKTVIEAILPDSPHVSFVCLPRPDTVVIYNQFEVTCFPLVDPATMGEGNHVLTLVALWTQQNPLAKSSLIYHISLTECAEALQPIPPAFEARFVEYERGVGIDTFTYWKIGPLGSFVEHPMSESLVNTTSLPDGLRSLPACSNNHFWSAVQVDDGISFFITPLEDVGRDGGWGTLYFHVPHSRFRDGVSGGARVMSLDLDIDRVSGRMVAWWADGERPDNDTRFIVLDLARDLPVGTVSRTHP